MAHTAAVCPEIDGNNGFEWFIFVQDTVGGVHNSKSTHVAEKKRKVTEMLIVQNIKKHKKICELEHFIVQFTTATPTDWRMYWSSWQSRLENVTLKPSATYIRSNINIKNVT